MENVCKYMYSLSVNTVYNNKHSIDSLLFVSMIGECT